MATVTKKSKSTAKAKAKAKQPTTVAAATADIPAANPLRIAPNETFNVDKSGRELPEGKVQLYVNGNDKGLADIKGRKLGEFVTEMAEKFGVRSFSVYADGNKLTQAAAEAKLDDPATLISKLEIVSKDTRA